MNEKQLQRSESVKEKILATAESEFSEHGYYGARIDAIAERSGINKRIIYQHFESKNLLYAKVLIRVYERLAARERSYMIEELSPVDAIRNVVHISFKFLKDDLSFVRVLMWENLNRGQALPAHTISDFKAPSHEYIKSKIRDGQEQGVFRKDIDIDQVVLSLTTFCFSYFSNIYTMSAIRNMDMMADDEIEMRVKFVTDVIIGYLTKR